jgi:hypothetical protein
MRSLKKFVFSGLKKEQDDGITDLYEGGFYEVSK